MSKFIYIQFYTWNTCFLFNYINYRKKLEYLSSVSSSSFSGVNTPSNSNINTACYCTKLTREFLGTSTNMFHIQLHKLESKNDFHSPNLQYGVDFECSVWILQSYFIARDNVNGNHWHSQYCFMHPTLLKSTKIELRHCFATLNFTVIVVSDLLFNWWRYNKHQIIISHSGHCFSKWQSSWKCLLQHKQI